MIHSSHCQHSRWQYSRRTLLDGTVHLGAQCMDCLSIIKLPEHDYRLWLKPSDIPAGATIHPFVEVRAND